MLSRAGLQISQGSSDLLQEAGARFQAQVYKTLVVPRLMYCAAESRALTELETFHNGSLRQILHHGPDGPSNAEFMATTGQSCMADLRVRWLGRK